MAFPTLPVHKCQNSQDYQNNILFFSCPCFALNIDTICVFQDGLTRVLPVTVQKPVTLEVFDPTKHWSAGSLLTENTVIFMESIPEPNCCCLKHYFSETLICIHIFYKPGEKKIRFRMTCCYSSSGGESSKAFCWSKVLPFMTEKSFLFFILLCDIRCYKVLTGWMSKRS